MGTRHLNWILTGPLLQCMSNIVHWPCPLLVYLKDIMYCLEKLWWIKNLPFPVSCLTILRHIDPSQNPWRNLSMAVSKRSEEDQYNSEKRKTFSFFITFIVSHGRRSETRSTFCWVLQHRFVMKPFQIHHRNVAATTCSQRYDIWQQVIFSV